MPNKRSGRNKKKRATSSENNENSVALVTPTVDVSVKCFNMIARYESNATLTNQSITALQLISAMLVQANTATLVYTVFYAMRIRKIVYYTPAIVSSSTSAMSFEWYTPGGNPFGTAPKSMVVGSVGTSYGGKHVFRPPKDSPWSNWITQTSPGGVTCFIHSVPQGTTVDVHFDAFTDNDDGRQSYAGFTGLTVGACYRIGIDCLPLASSNWLPLGFRRA